MISNKWKCRYAPSLGLLENSPEQTWGTEVYFDDPMDRFLHDPVVFFGVYGFPDFYKVWRHKGRKAILWAGSDINHFLNGYWLDKEGKIRLDPTPMAEWINKNCENYVENGVEHEALITLGIESKIIPSFLGHTMNYPMSYEHNTRPKVYLSVSGDNFDMYGWPIIEEIADKCNVDFYLFGNMKPWSTKHHNVFVLGRMTKEEMNDQIQHMQCGLRLNEFDGFSEVLAKSVLWGQHPISRIGYPHIDSFKTKEELIQLLNNLVNKTTPNIEGREYYKKYLNAYPWNENYKRT